jgi:GntR family transcriptional regulator, transcriptional repressor for pyruvate dehydrogenase complex
MVQPMEHDRESIVKQRGVVRAVAGPRSGAPARAQVRFRPVRTARAFEGIADQIRHQMAAGRLRVGDRLPPERELAEQFGVSRNTLREALRSLENAGLLRLQKGAWGGAFVRESSGDAVVAGFRDMFQLGAIAPEHLTEARVMIESIVVRVACERATSADIAALNANLAAAAKAARGKADFYDQAAIHLDFHRILARVTKNPVMVIVMESLLDVMQHFIRAIGQTRNPWVLPSRRRFMKQFAARDGDAAVAEMERHLERLNRHYLSLLRVKERAEAANA